jgi:hypothetical protein
MNRIRVGIIGEGIGRVHAQSIAFGIRGRNRRDFRSLY